MFRDLKNALSEDWSVKFFEELSDLSSCSGDEFGIILRKTAEVLSYYSLILKDGDTLEVSKDFDLLLGSRTLKWCDKKTLVQYQNFILALVHLVMQEVFTDEVRS